MKLNKKRTATLLSVFLMVIILLCVFIFSDDKELQKEVVEQITDRVTEMSTYEMSNKEIEELPSTNIIEQTEEQEKSLEQEVEDEGFELQGEIAYEGDKATTWNVELGDYKGLTYYSQIDSRWADEMYSSVGDRSQTIGSSGCGPTAASMIVTAIKGTITPDKMADLFVKYGYRSSNNGTYWSAFRAIADEFNIGYQETSNIDNVINLLKNNNYVVASVGNGLFTTGGHFIVLAGIDGDTIKIYDPYLYAGKFETSTRRGKVTVSGNTVYCSINNFKKYANAKGFFCYAHDKEVKENNSQEVKTSFYTRYVNAKIGLNIRNKPNGSIVGALVNKAKVTVYETSGNWSKIGTDRWVCSSYLSSYSQVENTVIPSVRGYITGNYKVTANVLNVRTGPGTNYKTKRYYELSTNARSQNSRLGNYYTNGYKKGVVCTVTKVNGSWGYTNSGWICLDYCTKI